VVPSLPPCRRIDGLLIGDDKHLAAALHDRIAAQPEPPVADAFAGRQMIFITMPGADDMHVCVGELLPHEGAVGGEDILDLVHENPLANRAALMHTEVL